MDVPVAANVLGTLGAVRTICVFGLRVWLTGADLLVRTTNPSDHHQLSPA